LKRDRACLAAPSVTHRHAITAVLSWIASTSFGRTKANAWTRSCS